MKKNNSYYLLRACCLPSPVSRALRHYLVDLVPFGSRYLIISTLWMQRQAPTGDLLEVPAQQVVETAFHPWGGGHSTPQSPCYPGHLALLITPFNSLLADGSAPGLPPWNSVSLELPNQSFKNHELDFPGSSAVKTLNFHCRGHGFHPWSEKIPHAAWCCQ